MYWIPYRITRPPRSQSYYLGMLNLSQCEGGGYGDGGGGGYGDGGGDDSHYYDSGGCYIKMIV